MHAHRQFSLLTLIVVVTAIAVWLGLLRWMPHVTVFLTATGILAISAVLLIRSYRRRRGVGRKVGCWLLTTASAAVFYVASIGPVFVLSDPGSDSTLTVFFEPINWLHEETILQQPLEAYARGWGWWK